MFQAIFQTVRGSAASKYPKVPPERTMQAAEGVVEGRPVLGDGNGIFFSLDARWIVDLYSN